MYIIILLLALRMINQHRPHDYILPNDSPNGFLPQVEEGAASNHEKLSPFDPGAGPSQAFYSSEDFRGCPKAGEWKTDRKSKKKGKSMIATTAPEMKIIAEKKKPVPLSKEKAVRRKLFGPKTKNSALTRDVYSSEDDDEEPEPDHLPELPRLPVLDYYTLVEIKTRTQSKFYLGCISKIKDNEGDYEVNFLSYRKYHTFVDPSANNIAAVNVKDAAGKPTSS